jgi:hypothetical protein
MVYAPAMDTVARWLWKLSLFGAVGAVVMLTIAWISPDGSSQQVAAASLACGIAIVPLALASSVEHLRR